MYLHVFDRSNLDEVVAKGPDGKQTTRLQDLEGSGHPRSDVVLMNGTNSGREYTLHVTMTGFSGDTFLLDVISAKQYTELQAFAGCMRRNAELHPAAKKLIC